MNKEQYIEVMTKYDKEFTKVWMKMADATNKFISENPEITMYSLQSINNIADCLALSGAWLYDRIANKNPRDRGAMTKKIRKVLGYSYP